MTNLFLPSIPVSPMYVGDRMTSEWQDFFFTLFTRIGKEDVLLASRLMSTDENGNMVSVDDFTEWVEGEVSQIDVTDSGDGKVILSISDLYLVASILGTENQVVVTGNGDGTATLSLADDTEVDSITLTDLTASRLTASDGNKKVVSVPDLTAWLAGTTDETTVTDDGDGTATIGLVHPVLLREPVTDWYDPTAGLPVGPAIGDRYISEATANGWTEDYIYEWDGTSWIESEPEEGWMVWMLLEFMFYFFFSGGWVEANNKAAVDADADAGYLGAANDDGVLRTSAPIAYTDGGDFITLSIQNSPLFYYVRLAAGTAAAGTGPIKFTPGVPLTTPETGVIEFHDNRFWVTNKSARKAIDRTSDVKITTTTVTDTTTETVVFTGLLPANSLVAENILKLYMYGGIDEAAAADEVTIRIKVGTTTVATILSPASGVSAKCWHIKGVAIIRSVGASGSMAWHIDMDAAGVSEDTCGISTIDTTVAENVTVTAEWNNAKAGNIFTCTGGFMEYKN